MDNSCRSQRVRRPQRARLVGVAQLLLGGVPEFVLAALGLAGLLPQLVRAIPDVLLGDVLPGDVLLGRIGQLRLLLVKRGPTLGGMGGLEAGPRRPAIGGEAGPRIQASIMRGSS